MFQLKIFTLSLFLPLALLSAAENSYKTLAIPAQGAYTGAYVDFGEGEDHVSLEAMENFEKLVGKHQAIIGFGSFWARQKFPTDQVKLVLSYGAVPLLYWSPWDTPFDNGQPHGPDRFSLDNILKGKWDRYIDQWADGAKAVPEQFFVAFGCEMNGTWFPWSGTFYGKGKLVSGNKNDKTARYAGPEEYKAAYRYVVDRVRARGATNILWVFHVNNYSYPNDHWNMIEAYYPGPKYVDWLGMSLYGKQYAEEDWDFFKPLLDWPYQELCMLDPQKPIMIAEWGTAEPHGGKGDGDKGAWYKDGLETMISNKYPRLKAAVVWHERWENPNGTFSNLRVSSSKGALENYRKGVTNPLWIDKPIWSSSEK